MDGESGIFSAALILILVMDPLGNIPFLLSLLKEVPTRRRRLVIAREMAIALFALLLFLYFGRSLLQALGLEQQSVSIAGGLVLLIIGIRMIFPSEDGVMGKQPEGEPLIVPFAIPMIAGPSALATLILMVGRAPDRMGDWLLALLIAWSVTIITLLSAPFLYRILHDRGLAAAERLMGMLLVMISVQMFVDGIRNFQLVPIK